MKKAASCIKTKTVNDLHGFKAKSSDEYFYVLMIGNNVLMNLTKHRNYYGTCYSSDSFTGDKGTLKGWKEFVVSRIERGYYGEVIKDMLHKEMGIVKK